MFEYWKRRDAQFAVLRLYVVCAEEEPELKDRGQGHPHRGDADRRVGVGLVADQPVVGVGLVEVIEDGGELQQPQVRVA